MSKKLVGDMLKEVRENSRIEADDLYNQIMPDSNLHRIESNKQPSDYDVTIKVIKRLSMDVAEFEFLRNGHHYEPLQEFMNELKGIRNSTNVSAMETLLEKVIKQIEQEETSSLINFKNMLLGYIKLQETKDIGEARVYFSKIWESLKEKESWYYNDMILISNILFTFEEEIMQQMFENLKKYYDLYDGFGDTNKMKRNTLYNYCSYLRFNKRLLEVEKPVKEVYQLAEADEDILMMMECRYCLCEVNWVKGEKSQSSKEVQFIISTLKYTEQNIIAEDIESDWYNLTGEKFE
ncbi:hypothetical protein [Listeria costaricensis]|uniref:hypothetical protein n=1 Tax=Listeria costaricensis TaxID=2026604 RepID=UPI000C06AABA|nr:hypothetical protein [Listeria costaricensis]